MTETFPYDGGREVTVFVPDAPPEVVVFAADGETTAAWGADLEAALVVGTHGLAEEWPRLHEYSPVFDLAVFEAHERFFLEVVDWAQDRFSIQPGRERTFVFGASGGGELALAMGMRHPDRFGAIFCGSPGGGYRPVDLPATIPRTYLVAGTQEPFFLENAARWDVALREVGADVVLHERDAGHDPAMWRAELPLMVAWASEG